MKNEFLKQQAEAEESIRMALDAQGVSAEDIMPLVQKLVLLNERMTKYNTVVEMDNVLNRAVDIYAKTSMAFKVEIMQTLG